MAATLPFHAPDRPAQKLRLIKAYGHFRKLIADKEDTAQVFHMSDCLPSPRSQRLAAAFCNSDRGQALMASEPYLPDILDDHDTLLATPAGSVAHAYVAFMRREGLSAAGLVEASTLPGRKSYLDQMQWFMDRLRDTHDLAHVLAGYGRDALGEQCVLGFTDGQFHDRTDWFIAWIGALEFSARVKSKAPVLRAVAEAQRNGCAALPIFQEDIRALLAEPLEAARARMGIRSPTLYLRSHDRLRARGIDPYDLFGAAAAA
jgi:ubiquinone biosynthesis protein COQ4